MSDINKFTSKEVLNKVLLDSSGDAVNAFSHTTQEALNAALDATNNRLNVSLAGGTISGDVTIAGDLTVNGGGSMAYSEVLTGDMIIVNGAGTLPTLFAGHQLVLQNNDDSGDQSRLAIISGATGYSVIDFGDASDVDAGGIAYQNHGSADLMTLRVNASDFVFIKDSGVGIGASPDTTLHIMTSDASLTTADTNASVIIEENDHTYLELLTPSDKQSGIIFSNGTLSSSGIINYNQSTDAMTFNTDGDTALTIDASQNVEVNNAALKIKTAGQELQWVNGATKLTGADTYLEFNVNSARRFKLDANSRISLSNNDASGAVGTTLFGYKAGLNIVSGAVSNTFIGHEVADATLTNAADYNTAVGGSALSGLTSGYSNAAFGFQSLFSNTDGLQNTAIGTSALYSNVGTDNNTAVGDQAGMFTTGASNTYVGQSAGRGASGADANNVGVGHNALLAITSATYNTSVGSGSGDALTTGAFNTSIGAVSLSLATTALNNTAIGFNAMSDVKAGVAVDGCVAIGKAALVGNANNTTGINGTVAIGKSALSALTASPGGTVVGYQSGKNVTTADYSTALGYNTLGGNSSTALYGNDNTALGANAGRDMEGAAEGNVLVGKDAGISMTTGNFNVLIGRDAGDALVDETHNTAIGTDALTGSSLVDQTVIVGSQAGMGAMEATADGTIAVGYSALAALTSGGSNTAIGFESQLYQTDGANNTSLGYKALRNADNGESLNTVIGTKACEFLNHASSDGNTVVGTQANVGGTGARAYNTVMGYRAMGSANTQNNIGGNENVFIGAYSGNGTWVTAGCDGNTAVGYNSLSGALNGATDNVAFGKSALGALTTGDRNTAIGTNAGATSTGVGKTVLIGYNAGGSNMTSDADGTIAIGEHAGYALTSGIANVAMGFQALFAEDDGDKSTAIGYQALTAQTGTSGTVANTAVGYQAGSNITTGTENTIVGAFSTASVVGGVNQTVIGSGITGNADNSVVLGNTSVTDVYMAKDSGATVHCAGIKFDASGEVLGDYEEGTYTVTLTPSTSGSITVNSSYDTASYTKIGRQVTVTGAIDTSAISSPVGFIKVNVPFTIGANTELSHRASGSVVVYSASSNIQDYMVFADGGEAYFRIYLSTGTTLATTSAATIDASTSIAFTFTYFA